MGLVYADIELINAAEKVMAKRHLIGDDEVNSIRINMLVDSGAYMMAINETICQQLNLTPTGKRKAQMADSSVVEYDVVGPIEVRFKNRDTACNALVLPGDSEPLLGAIPMEEMDVLIHPLRQELIVNPEHPNFAQLKMK
ncbi:MAG: retroviral-like aspartic protease family protein [Bacteroidota bacterium]|jgi:clan AA aspartic protease